MPLSKAPQGPAWPDVVYSINQRLLLLLWEQPGAGIRGRTPGEGPSLTHGAIPWPPPTPPPALLLWLAPVRPPFPSAHSSGECLLSSLWALGTGDGRSTFSRDWDGVGAGGRSRRAPEIH